MSFEVDITLRRGAAVIRTDFVISPRIGALVGPSGAGKTSILDAVAGLLRPERGRISVDGTVLFDSERGVNLRPDRRACGYVFQDDRLFPHMSVKENLLYGWRLAPPERRWMAMEEALAFLGIGHLLERRPATLSGGEAQRVAIGRALLSAPRFLLMDEPLSSLDLARREEVAAVIERIRDELSLPVLYVSHELAEVERLAGEVVRLAPPIGPGSA